MGQHENTLYEIAIAVWVVLMALGPAPLFKCCKDAIRHLSNLLDTERTNIL